MATESGDPNDATEGRDERDSDSGSETTDSTTAAELDERQRSFLDVANGVARDIDAERLVELAKKGAEYENKMSEAESSGNADDRNEEEEGEDGDEFMTKAEFRAAQKKIREEREQSQRMQTLQSGHDRNVGRYNFKSETQAQHIRYVVDGYMQQNSNQNIDKVYEWVTRENGIEPIGRSAIGRAAELANARTPSRGRSANQSPPKEKDPSWYLSEDADDYFLNKELGIG